MGSAAVKRGSSPFWDVPRQKLDLALPLSWRPRRLRYQPEILSIPSRIAHIRLNKLRFGGRFQAAETWAYFSDPMDEKITQAWQPRAEVGLDLPSRA